MVFAKDDLADDAEKAGADYVGSADMVEKVKGGWTDVDVVIATPDMMAEVGKLGKILGREANANLKQEQSLWILQRLLLR